MARRGQLVGHGGATPDERGDDAPDSGLDGDFEAEGNRLDLAAMWAETVFSTSVTSTPH